MSHRDPGPLLHARSRRLYPAGAALLGLALAAPLAAHALDATTGGPAAVVQVLAVAAGVSMAGPGLAAADPDLEAATPRSRPLLRVAHLAIAALVIIMALTTGEAMIHPSGYAGSWDNLQFIGRDVAGLLGLQVGAAALAGSRLCWIPASCWVLVLSAVGARDTGWRLLASMPLSPPDSVTAAVSAACLLAAGAAAYAVRRVIR